MNYVRVSLVALGFSQTGCKDTDFFITSKFFRKNFEKKLHSAVFYYVEGPIKDNIPPLDGPCIHFQPKNLYFCSRSSPYI